MKRFISGLLVAAIASAGCADSTADATGQPGGALSSYSGEELYTGVLFGQGRARAAVPSVETFIDEAETLTAEQRERVTKIVAEINRLDPTFFDAFEQNVRSGDRVTIREALRDAVKMTGQAHASLRKMSTDDVITMSKDLRINIPTPFDSDPFVDVETAVFAVVAAFIFVIVFDFSHTGQAPDEGLVIDSLADELAALSES